MDETPEKHETNHFVRTLIWLLVGLAPGPLLLIIISTLNRGNELSETTIRFLLVIIPLCNLAGGIGCLGGVRNVAWRIFLGLLLGGFFCALTIIVAILQACSGGHF